MSETDQDKTLAASLDRLRDSFVVLRNSILEECAVLAEKLKEDRFGKLVNFQVADAIREMKVEK